MFSRLADKFKRKGTEEKFEVTLRISTLSPWPSTAKFKRLCVRWDRGGKVRVLRRAAPRRSCGARPLARTRQLRSAALAARRAPAAAGSGRRATPSGGASADAAACGARSAPA